MKKIGWIGLLLAGILLLWGCERNPGYTKKVRDIDYTVVEADQLPEDLKKAVEEKKGKGFKLTFAQGEYLYIVVGFGEKPTGGYSVSVKDLYLTKNAIFFDTELTGPGGEDVISQTPSYPYIAVKMEYMDYSVIFD